MVWHGMPVLGRAAFFSFLELCYSIIHLRYLSITYLLIFSASKYWTLERDNEYTI